MEVQSTAMTILRKFISTVRKNSRVPQWFVARQRDLDPKPQSDPKVQQESLKKRDMIIERIYWVQLRIFRSFLLVSVKQSLDNSSVSILPQIGTCLPIFAQLGPRISQNVNLLFYCTINWQFSPKISGLNTAWDPNLLGFYFH